MPWVKPHWRQPKGHARIDMLPATPQTSFLDLSPDPCARKHGGDRESAAAFRSADRQGQREVIFATLVRLAARRNGMTLDELATYLDVAPNQISGRITELQRQGRIVWTGQQRLTRTRCAAKVWRPVLPAEVAS